MATVLLAMSGGVDSSVAAHLLLQQGHQVVGVFMHNVECAPGALDARRVADQLNLPFRELDLQRDFSRVVDYFVDEYVAGRTPNPCVVCNRWLKFGKLFEYADSLGADYVATGHYARLTAETSGALALRRARDRTKDQSYALCAVSRQRLSRMMLPVGDHSKNEIRRIAERIGLRVATKQDSQDICFVSPGKHDEFVASRRRRLDTAGEIVTTDGRVVGRHQGIERFTVGQRKGLGVALGQPYFVMRIEPDSRRVVIGKKHELARRELTARQLNWLVDTPKGPMRCSAQLRYNSRDIPATAEPMEHGRLHVILDEAYFGIAPGQAVVCYDADRVLCGGWIE